MSSQTALPQTPSAAAFLRRQTEFLPGGAAIEINQGAHHNIITGNEASAFPETSYWILNASDNRVGGINLSIGKIEGYNFEDNESGIIISEAASVRDSTPVHLRSTLVK
ncbi:MAG: hypothetical protein IPG58_17440 [Acidobacteria bacterium]|nr:hypothetical protein [Acidobacteriota bacterium]